MSRIKSYSVGDGDMFYIDHNSDNFTIIDCCLDQEFDRWILNEISDLSSRKGVTRFISTHPDEDHIQGLVALDDRIGILNFYCVKNNTSKDEETLDFRRYKHLRSSDKAFFIHKGCSRRWMNTNSPERGSSGINVLWPDLENEQFENARQIAAQGKSPNNISPIIKYSLNDGVTALWMGDLETEFMEAIEGDVQICAVDLLFAPHHGRASGRIPRNMLNDLNPRVIVIGEAPSVHLNYYKGFNTITQNSAGHIVFDCVERKVRIFTSEYYQVGFLDYETNCQLNGFHYLGTLNL